MLSLTDCTRFLPCQSQRSAKVHPTTSELDRSSTLSRANSAASQLTNHSAQYNPQKNRTTTITMREASRDDNSIVTLQNANTTTDKPNTTDGMSKIKNGLHRMKPLLCMLAGAGLFAGVTIATGGASAIVVLAALMLGALLGGTVSALPGCSGTQSNPQHTPQMTPSNTI